MNRLYALLLGIILGAALGVLAGEAIAHAEQRYGGCNASGLLCAGPSASLTVASFNLATSSFSGGVAPGVGYGATIGVGRWWAAGLDLYASLRLGQGQPNQATFALMGHFADYVFIGIGPAVTQREAGQSALVQWSILGGIGVPSGRSSP